MQKVLSALVVHDIKNVLALLEIDLEQLNHRADVPEEGRRAYRRCIDLKNRLINFLTLYKRDQTGLMPMLREIDLVEFTEDMIRNSQSVMMAENHHGHQITVRADFERMTTGGATGGMGLFDENLVELALESALNNAVRYAHHEVLVWFEQVEDALAFKVFDDGVGVGVVDKLMQRNVAEKSSSTGLGLALCKAVAEAHGAGSVKLESVEGGGTLFTMELRCE
ncbi:MAG: ATP-binding protein [Gallionella sp.]|jgi:signal transduction histidine kinase